MKDNNGPKPPADMEDNSKNYSVKEFYKQELGVDSPKDLKIDKIKKMAGKKLKKIDPEILKKYLEVNPALAATLTDVVKGLTSSITNIKETQKARYELLKVMVNSGHLTGDQIITALKIIQELEKDDNVIIHEVVDSLKKIGGYVLMGIAAAAAAFFGADSLNSQSKGKGRKKKKKILQ
jgi:Glu-tRNA(Gln) amidotransferase subunit E-like FAD-binding protein